MELIFILVLFIWTIVLHNDVKTLQRKLQDFINESYILSRKNSCANIDCFKDESRILPAVHPVEPFVERTVPISETKIENEHSKQPQQNAEKIETSNVVEKSGFEKIFLGNIFNKIGALAIIIGIGFFVKLVSQFIVFTPVMRICIAAVAGVLMIAGSLKLHKDKMKNYAEVLMGTGTAVLFITLYCATGLYHLISLGAASALGLLFVIFTWIISEKYNTFSTFLIGLFGGYLNPFFINSNITQDFLFGYLIFLNLISITYVLKNESKQALNYINLFLSFFTMSIFSLFHGNEVNFYYPIALWGVYTINNILLIYKHKSNENITSRLGLNYINYGFLILFTKMFNPDKFMETGLFLLSATVIYTLMLIVVKTKDNETLKEFTYGAVLSLLIGTYFTFTSTARISLWAIEGALIAYIALRYKYLANWSAAYLIAAFSGIFFVKNAIYFEDINLYNPIWNFRLILFGIPIVSSIFASIILKENEKISNVFKFLYVSFLYLFVIFEINNAYAKYAVSSEFDVDKMKHLTHCIIGFIYAMNAKRLGTYLKSTLFNIAAGTIFVFSIITLLFNAGNNASIGSLPILNLGFVAFMFAIATSIYYSIKTKSSIYNYLALILGFVAFHFEVSSFTNGNAMAISVTWILYAGLITLVGIFKDLNVMKKAGIWISLIAVAKITLFDLAYLEPQYKIISFMTLGIILMVVSFYYNKLKNSGS